MSPHSAVITLCFAAVAGVALIAIAHRLRMPSIALLLAGGVALGPEALNLVDPGDLGAGLETVVMLAVAVILFEGGLTLDVAGFRREPTVIVRLLTVGVLITWVGSAAAVYFVYDVGIELAIITGSLVIVTGPTVVSPLLRRIGVQPRLHHILYWEGVMIDAVGVFVAVLCYEWIASMGDSSLTPLARFLSRFAVGAGIGLAFGLATAEMLRRRWIASEHVNIVVLASALAALALANAVLPEAGILAVIAAGLVLSLRASTQLKEVRRFKLELTELSIGLLFVLLAAHLDLDMFVRDGGLLIIVLAVILFALRPLNILVSTWGQGFSWRERAFLSWLAPRGIVAASMASLFALRLGRLGYEHAELLEVVTYAVIATTVIVQGLSAHVVARALGLQRRSNAAWLLIGDPDLAVTLHRTLRQAGIRSIVFAAAEPSEEPTGEDGVETMVGDSTVPTEIADPRIADIEAVLALSLDVKGNDRICQAWSTVVGPAACYRWDGDSETSTSGHGRPIWTDLPPPAQIKAAIADNTVVIDAVEVGPPEDARRFGPNLRPLFATDEGRVVVVDSALEGTAEKVVVLRRRATGLVGLVRDAVILDAHRVSFRDAVSALLERAVRTSPELTIEQHLSEILDRESAMPTAIGGGVAIPHVYDDTVARSQCYLANAPGGLDLSAPDDQPVRLIFLVVSPAAKATEHLNALAAIARLASNNDLVEVLAGQRTRTRLLALLRERE